MSHLRYVIITKLVEWAMLMLPDENPGKLALATAQLMICSEWEKLDGGQGRVT